jgi:hypothetical protein
VSALLSVIRHRARADTWVRPYEPALRACAGPVGKRGPVTTSHESPITTHPPKSV